MPTREEVAKVLAGLTVGKGGVMSSKRLTPDVRVMFSENPDRDTWGTHGYELALEVQGGRTQRVLLKWKQVFSKTKTSMWARDRVWRLTPESVETFSEQIVKVLEVVEQRRATPA